MADTLLFAHSVEEAVSQKKATASYLAGGTEINRLNATVDPETLISIKKIPSLRCVYEDGDTVWLGSTVTFQGAIEHPLVPGWFKEACSMMASRTKRNMATVGGNIALLRDDSYIVPALLAAHATLVCACKDGEEISLAICAYMEERKAGRLGDALIVRIGLSKNRKVTLKRYANTAMSHSVLNIGFGVSSEGKEISIGVAAKNSGLYDMKALAAAIEAEPGADEARVADMVKASGEPGLTDDMFGSAAYKRYLLETTVARMVSLAR